MSKPEENISSRRPLTWSWPTALSLFTAVVAAGTVTLHLIGDVQHRHFLAHWNIDPGLFPKAADRILINGYYGVVDRFIAILSAVFGNLHWLVIAAAILGVYVFLLLSPVTGASGRPSAWLMRQPEWRRRFLRQFLLTALFVGTVPCALLLLTAFMAVPAAFGETAGKAAAENAASEFRKGCEKSKIPCAELRREGEVIATGFVLDSTQSHIAIFDIQMKRGRVLPLDKLEVMSNRIPKLMESTAH